MLLKILHVFVGATWSASKGIKCPQEEEERMHMQEDCERVMDDKVDKSKLEILNLMDNQLKVKNKKPVSFKSYVCSNYVLGNEGEETKRHVRG